MENNHQQTKFSGAIPLLRKFQDHPFWAERRKFSRAEAWIDLLFQARYGSETAEIVDRDEMIRIEYSQILTSTITLSKKWKRSRVWVRNLLQTLRELGSIAIITMNNRRTILQIVGMGKVRDQLQGNAQHSAQLTLQQESSRTTHKNKENKENKEITLEEKLINDLISLFSEINPSYKLLYSNLTERKSIERLIAQQGEAKTRELILSLPQMIYEQFAPMVTTPYELEAKLGKVLLFLSREKERKEKGGVINV